MRNATKWVLCIAMLILAGIRNFTFGQSRIEDEQSKVIVTSMTVCGDNVFAGTKKGVYRSTGGGKVWGLVNNNLPAPAWIAGLTSIGKNVFTVGFFPSLMLFTSADNGDHWKQVILGDTDLKVTNVCAFKGKVFAASAKGLYVSSDEGAHWSLDPEINEGFVYSVIAARSFMFVSMDTKSGAKEFYSSADGEKWGKIKSEGVHPEIEAAAGDNIVGTLCQRSFNTDSRYACRDYKLWVLGRSIRKWEEVDFTARYFAFDGDDMYAIKVQVTNDKKKEPGYERELLKSEDRGRSWQTIDEKTDPFVSSDYAMQEKLQELDYWKSFEIEEVLAIRRGEKLAAEKKEREWQAELKKRREAPVREYAPSNTKPKYGTLEHPDYRALSQDRFNAAHNTHSYIDSKGGMHIR